MALVNAYLKKKCLQSRVAVSLAFVFLLFVSITLFIWVSFIRFVCPLNLLVASNPTHSQTNTHFWLFVLTAFFVFHSLSLSLCVYFLALFLYACDRIMIVALISIGCIQSVCPVSTQRPWHKLNSLKMMCVILANFLLNLLHFLMTMRDFFCLSLSLPLFYVCVCVWQASVCHIWPQITDFHFAFSGFVCKCCVVVFFSSTFVSFCHSYISVSVLLVFSFSDDECVWKNVQC